MRSSILLASVPVAIAAFMLSVPSVARADDATAAQPPAAAAPAVAAPPAAPAPPAGEAPAAHSGDHPSPNSVYLEGLGAGLDYSLNYERVLFDQLALRAGVSYLSIQPATAPGTASATVTYVTVPMTASYIGLRKGWSSLELGAGGMVVYTSGAASALGVSASGSGVLPAGVVMVGYRLHPVDHAGFQFRVGVMALMGEAFGLSAADPTRFGVIPWPYISFGASF
jgi:hypothetical protein